MELFPDIMLQPSVTAIPQSFRDPATVYGYFPLLWTAANNLCRSGAILPRFILQAFRSNTTYHSALDEPMTIATCLTQGQNNRGCSST